MSSKILAINLILRRSTPSLLNQTHRYIRQLPSHDDDVQESRMSYVDFIDESLSKLKELGVDKEINSYKELLRVFPPGKYHPKSIGDIGMFSAPQQLCGIRILTHMEIAGVKPDKEMEILVERAFSRHSQVWLKICRMNYWTMKGRNLDPYPIPEKLPDNPKELAKIAIERMVDDPRTRMIIGDASSIANSKDKTWIIYSQSPVQSEIIEKLDEKSVLYIEDCGLTYVGENYLSYFALKVYDDEEYKKSITREPPTFNYNRLKVKFWGKPIREKLMEMEDQYHIDNYRLLAIGMTGTSSNDSLSSWLKLMQQRNPKLARMNVVFKTYTPTLEPPVPVGESCDQYRDDSYQAKKSSLGDSKGD